MGDVVSLVERAQEQFDEEEAERKDSKKKLLKNGLVLMISSPASVKNG
jgi:signal recognition particle GTPase